MDVGVDTRAGGCPLLNVDARLARWRLRRASAERDHDGFRPCSLARRRQIARLHTAHVTRSARRIRLPQVIQGHLDPFAATRCPARDVHELHAEKMGATFAARAARLVAAGRGVKDGLYRVALFAARRQGVWRHPQRLASVQELWRPENTFPTSCGAHS